MPDPRTDNVIIVDRSGQEHIFPPGFDPKRAAAIVRDRAPRGETSTPLPAGATLPDALPQSRVSDEDLAPSDSGGLGASTMGALATQAPRATRLVSAAARGLQQPAIPGVPGLTWGRAPGILAATDVVGDVFRGDFTGAATSVASTAAASQLPKVLSGVEQMTAPYRQGPAGQFGKAPGIVMRGAQQVSKAAGPIALATQAIEEATTNRGHRPPGEEPGRTAQRQQDFQQQYDAMRERARPQVAPPSMFQGAPTPGLPAEAGSLTQLPPSAARIGPNPNPRNMLGRAIDTGLEELREQPISRVLDIAGMSPATHLQQIMGGEDPLQVLGPDLAGVPIVGKAAKAIPGIVGKNADVLTQRWPRVAKALAKHGTELQLAGRSPSAALARLSNDVHANTLANGGATVYPMTGQVELPGTTSGFMVGKFSNQSGNTFVIPQGDFKPEHVRAFIEKNADTLVKNPNLAVGAWIDKGNVYIDVAQNKPSHRKAAMTARGQAQPAGTVRDPVTGEWPKAQEAVYDLAADKSRPVGNLAEFLNSPEFQERLDVMYQAGVPVMNGKEWWNLYGGPLERVYGKERVAPLAGFLASTSPASAPVHNLRSASEYLRRLIKNEPIIQPDFRIPESAVGSREGMMGAMTPGDYNAPGTKMPMEQTRAPNLRRVARGEMSQLQEDKVNDMFHALTGEDVGVYDRRYAKLAEDWDRGIFVDATKDKVPGTMGDTAASPSPSPYALIENAVRTGAQRHNMPLGRFSAYVWEGIGDTIKRTGQLFGMKHPAHTIPDASQGFAGIFDAMVKEKADAWGISVAEMETRLRNGDAELLTALLATPVGLAAYRQWEQADQQTDSLSGPQ